jgi:predicted P-loop ATPase
MSAANIPAGGRDVLTPLRLQLRENGFRPVPVAGPRMRCKTPGKQPVMRDWPQKCRTADEAEVRRWATDEPGCINTGLLCDDMAGVDIDVPVPRLAAQVEALVVAKLGKTPLRRVGWAPKVLLAYRTTSPLKKLATPELFLPDGTKVQVEILGDGQQFVAYGVHPDTGREYEWTRSGPDVVPLVELPAVTETQCRQVLAEAEAMLRAAGGRTQKEIDAATGKAAEGPAEPDRSTTTTTRPKASSGPRSDVGGDGFFKAVNRAALDRIEAWVPQLFGAKAKRQASGGYRISSADLDRDQEEDLSIHPDGVQDFGPRKGMSPCDVVMEFGGAPSPQAAAFALCEWLGRDPAEFGWKETRARPEPKARKTRPHDDAAPEQGDDEAWCEALIRTERGKVAACAANVETMLLNHPRWRDVLWFDEFAVRPMVRRPPPWEPDLPRDQWRARPLVDDDLTRAAIWMQRNGVMMAEQRIKASVDVACRARSEHPLRAYLEGLPWDGKPRLDQWLTTYVGAEDNAYHRAVGARWMIGAVARVYRPGCKLDTALVLEGAQGIGKSSVARALAGKDYFTDHLPDLTNKDAMIQIQGKWIVEIAELAALGRAEAARIKSFMSTECDRFRGPWGVLAQDYPRQCAFIGTVNPEAGYLKDPTGGRRFWAVRCGGALDLAGLRQDRDQLWAEAVARFKGGEPWWLDTDQLETAAKEQQAERYAGDAKDDLIAAWVEHKPYVTIGEVLEGALGVHDRSRWSQAEQNTVARCLIALGWERKQVRVGTRREWRYVRPPLAPQPTEGGDTGQW